MNSLSKTILVTRPKPAGKELCQALAAKGMLAIHFPTIDFVPYPLHADQQDFYDWAIFTSPQAVYFWLQSSSKPSLTRIAAVGYGTAKALWESGFPSAIYPSSEWNSEGLLALPEFQSIKGKKIAIVGGVGGRELLQQTFLARGAEVKKICVYQRVLPQVKHTVLAQIKKKKFFALVCTSGEGLLNLTQLLADFPAIFSIPLIVPSSRIKKLAQQLNFQTIWLAENASHQSILQTLAQRK